MSTRTRDVETDLTRFYAMFPQPLLARDVFNIVEGHRIDSRIRVLYPGIRRDIDATHAFAASQRPAIHEVGDTQVVVEALLQRILGMEPDVTTLPEELAAPARAALEALAAFPAEEASVTDSARLTVELYALVERAAEAGASLPRPSDSPPPPQPGEEAAPPEAGQADADEDEGPEEYQPLELPPFMTQVMEELVQPPTDAPAEREAEGEEANKEREGADQEMDGAMQSTRVEAGKGAAPDDVAQNAEADIDTPPGDQPSGTEADNTDTGGLTPGGPAPDVPDSSGEADVGEETFAYDEWDYRIEDYRPAWCTLRETRATRTQEGFVAATFHEFGGIVTQIRRSFQLMRPERLRKMRYQTEGDELDIDGLVEYVVDKRARADTSDRVYIKRDKKERDVATAFLVDMSSSTDRKIDGRKRILDIEKEALLLMCEALEAIRDEYAIYGFSGNGREDAQFYVVKELGERYDDRVKGRIGGIYAHQKTRMGPAIRHATRRLTQADAAVKLLILLTDGKPYDSDTYQDNQYAQEDTKIALREARREKIHLFCVTVDQEAADYLPNMYSDANFVIIDDVRTLPQRLPQLYRRLTT